jgi:hypothetical protein
MAFAPRNDLMDCFVVSLLHKELSSSGLTGRSGTLRPFGSIISVSGILDHPLSRVMTGYELWLARPR